MCGIFGYAQYDLPLTRKDMIAILTNALRRLEYRGYDSAGLAVDQGTEDERAGPLVIKEKGNIDQLAKYVPVTARCRKFWVGLVWFDLVWARLPGEGWDCVPSIRSRLCAKTVCVSAGRVRCTDLTRSVRAWHRRTAEVVAENSVDMNVVFKTHVGIAHTRWATHGQPSRVNRYSALTFVCVCVWCLSDSDGDGGVRG